MKNLKETFWSMTFHKKLWLVQNLCVFGSIKQIDLFEFMMEPGT